MSEVVQSVGSFFLYAVLAVFVQNAVFTRGFGVSRLTKLVGDSAMDSMTFCALLCLIQVIAAPMGFWVNRLLEQPPFWYREYLRPLALTLCALVAFGLVLLVVLAAKPPNQKDILAVLPMATCNCSVLGFMLLMAVQPLGFVQTMGFALGSGLGYTFAVLIVGEGQRKLNNRNVPNTFRGLPINLVYIGILALAIYGLTGHRLVR